jgi:hypothetical protein
MVLSFTRSQWQTSMMTASVDPTVLIVNIIFKTLCCAGGRAARIGREPQLATAGTAGVGPKKRPAPLASAQKQKAGAAGVGPKAKGRRG